MNVDQLKKLKKGARIRPSIFHRTWEVVEVKADGLVLRSGNWTLHKPWSELVGYIEV
jgi:hypothetical protein